MQCELHRVVVVQQMENIDAESDVYDELLTQAEIQGNVNKVNGESQQRTRVFTVRWFLRSTTKGQRLPHSEQRSECR